jgi:hypothetical protein
MTASSPSTQAGRDETTSNEISSERAERMGEGTLEVRSGGEGGGA